MTKGIRRGKPSIEEVINFLNTRTEFKSGRLIQLSATSSVKPGDMILEVMSGFSGAALYQLSDQRRYEPQYTADLPKNLYLSQSFYERKNQLHTAWITDFSHFINDTIIAEDVYHEYRSRFEAYPIDLSGQQLSSGRFFRVETEYRNCTANLLYKIVHGKPAHA